MSTRSGRSKTVTKRIYRGRYVCNTKAARETSRNAGSPRPYPAIFREGVDKEDENPFPHRRGGRLHEVAADVKSPDSLPRSAPLLNRSERGPMISRKKVG